PPTRRPGARQGRSASWPRSPCSASDGARLASASRRLRRRSPERRNAHRRSEPISGTPYVRRKVFSNSLERHVRGQAEDSSQCAAPLEAVAAGDANVEGEPAAEGPEAGQEILDLEAHPSVEAIGAGKVGRSDAEIGREIHAVVEGEIESQGPQHTGDAVDCGIRPGGPGRGQAHRLLQARAERDKTVPQPRVAAQEGPA